MAVKETALVTSTAAIAGGSTYAIQSSSSATDEPTAEEAKKKNSIESKETKPEVFDSVIVEKVSDVFKGVSQYRFASSTKTKDKLLIEWDDLDSWVKKVNDNVTSKEVWPGDLIFWSNRSSKNYARQLRQKCYQAADYLTRVAFDDNQSNNLIKDLFKNVQENYQDSQLTTLCASDQAYPEENRTKFSNSTWSTLSTYLTTNTTYSIVENVPEGNEEAKKFHEEKSKTVVNGMSFKESMGKYTVYVIKQQGESDKFASKENFGIVYDKLEDIPFLKDVLSKKQ